MRKRAAAVVGGIVVLLAVGVFALRKPQPSLAQQYEFVPVKRMDLSERIDATGSVLALEKKDLYADYDAAVERVNVKAGDFIKKGQILLTLASSTLKEQWQDADSTLKQAQVNLDVATGQLATEVALNHVTTTNALQVENDYRQVQLYKEQVSQAQQRLAALNARNDGYYVADNARLFIRAPFDGQVAWINVTQGDKISPQTLLATVTNPEALGVEAQIDQNDISVIRAGQAAVVTGKDPARTQNPGVVTAISAIGHSDQSTGATGQASAATGGVIDFPVQIRLTGQTQGLKPGMSVDVTVLANEHPDVLAVPAGSVIQRNGRDMVNVRKGDRLVPTPVQLGFERGKYWEVMSGLKAGDLVALAKPTLSGKQALAQGAGPSPGMTPFGRLGR